MSRQSPHESGKSKGLPGWLQKLASTLGFGSSAGIRQSLERAIAEAEAEGEDPLPLQQRTMLLNLLEFGSLRASDVMVPRVDIVAIGQDRPVSALLQLFHKAGHSRIPVYSTSLDDAIGMVHIRDALMWLTENANPGKLTSSGPLTTAQALNLGYVDLTKSIAEANLVRNVLFAPSSMPVVDLLANMRSEQTHLALIVDEYGGTDGLVSIEDIVEQIVGDISDEHDTDDAAEVKTEGNALIVSARTPIETVESMLEVDLTGELEDEVDTVGGFIFVMAGRVPKRGFTLSHASGVSFEVLEASARRVQKVRIQKALSLPAPEDGEQLLLPPPGGSDADAHKAKETANAGAVSGAKAA